MLELNRVLVSDPAAPFGAVKQSGIGRDGGHAGLEYTEAKYFRYRVTRPLRRESLGGVIASSSTVQAVFLLTILALGYVVCFALWWFVFRGKGED
jgi:hypothetical protein